MAMCSFEVEAGTGVSQSEKLIEAAGHHPIGKCTAYSAERQLVLDPILER